jgi:hypothetical protein
MASNRKFYRTVIEVEVLSNQEFEFDSLESVHEAITTGDCSGDWRTTLSNSQTDGPTMAKLLIGQASDPSFFGLDEEGNDLEDDEE